MGMPETDTQIASATTRRSRDSKVDLERKTARCSRSFNPLRASRIVRVLFHSETAFPDSIDRSDR